MEKVTFLQSLIKILKLISSIPFFIEILILTVFLLIIMIFFYFRKSKKGKITSLIIYFVTLFLLPISHFSFFVDTLDKIIENFVAIIYFPSCYIYIAILLITDFSILVNVIKNTKNVKKGKWYQSLDIIYFFVFQFLFFLIVRVVITENIDIFTRTSLYSDANLTSLIQISSYLFWIRIGIKFIVLIIDRLSKFSFKSNKKDKNEISSNDGLAESKTEVDVETGVKVDIDSNNNIDNKIVRSESITSVSQDSKVVKPLEIIEGDLFKIDNYDNSYRYDDVKNEAKSQIQAKVSIDNDLEKLEINNSLSHPEVVQHDIKSMYDLPEHERINMDNNINAIDTNLEVLDLSEENNSTVPLINLNTNEDSAIETLDMNEDYSYQFEGKTFSTAFVDKISPFDILKEAEQYVPINQEQYKINNSIDLTIDNNSDNNDNYFDDFYE